MNERLRLPSGQFASPHREPRGDAIAFRLSQSLDKELREIVGWQSSADNKQLREWVIEAVRQRVVRNRRRGKK